MIKRIICWFAGHKWTSEAMKGNPPTKFQLDSGYKGWQDYAKMYCDRCGKVSDLNKNL